MADKVKDHFIPGSYDAQRIDGILGERMKLNLEGRLLHVDEAALLGGFRNRPGKQEWIGEHAGKFLDAASNTWAYTGDARLKRLMDRVAQALVAAQLPDGYLGTYTEDQRWTSWDVWVHKYDLIGLLSYYQVTGNAAALTAARKIGDLLVETFGTGQRDLIQAGTHTGMAATSVLEPLCTLYRFTGDRRYLDFAISITRAYDRPGGPKLIVALQENANVSKVADAKAYEMMSNLIGLIELYRITGDARYFRPAVNAWQDIAKRRLYITGTTSAAEYFRDDQELPGEEAASVGEGCATVTWLQLNWHLLRVTGEPQYAAEIERTVYNQLLGAQDRHNGDICYFTPLVGKKRPTPGVNCCVSSEPRGISMIPQLAWGEREGGVAVLLYAPGEIAVRARPNAEVRFQSETKFPADGNVVLTYQGTAARQFTLFLRVPAWTTRFSASVKGVQAGGQPGQFFPIDRLWTPGDQVEIQMDMTAQVLQGGKSYPDHVALQRGPQVLALEAALNPQITYLQRAAPKLEGTPRLEDVSARMGAGWPQAYAIPGTFQGKSVWLNLTPFADALNYRVWLVRPDRIPIGAVALTAFGTESWSRSGTGDGSICDERPDTYRTTLQGRPAKEDWYAVEVEQPITIARVVFRHGKLFENGGWFDTTEGKPQIQVKRTKTSEWETIATLDTYPDGSAKQPPPLRDGEAFTVKPNPPARAVAVRILGKPGGAFSSCAELAAYGQ